MIVDGASGLPHLLHRTSTPQDLGRVLVNVSTHVLAVKAVLPDRPFGVGLRLSAEAARPGPASGTGRLSRLLYGPRPLRLHHQQVPLRRVSPYGGQGERLPPRRLEDERVAYTDQLATILAALVPAGQGGSVSTVPGCFVDALVSTPAR